MQGFTSPGSAMPAAHCHKALHCSDSCLAAYLRVQCCDLTALRVLPCCKQPAAVLTEAQHFQAGTGFSAGRVSVFRVVEDLTGLCWV